MSTETITFLKETFEDSLWNDYRLVALVSGITWFGVYSSIGIKGGVHWYSLIHATISGAGALFCTYVNVFQAVSISGTPEPLRIIQCEEPLTPLHNLLPAMVLGYSFTEIVHNLKPEGEKQLLFHGIIMAAVMFFVCVTGVQHTIVPMLLMELSSIALNAYEAEFVGPTIKFSCLAAFAILFFVFRILIVPYLWAEFTWILYKETADPASITNAANCFPANYIYVVLVFGFLFHGLNFFWFTLVVKKMIKEFKRWRSGEKTQTKLE